MSSPQGMRPEVDMIAWPIGSSGNIGKRLQNF